MASSTPLAVGYGSGSLTVARRLDGALLGIRGDGWSEVDPRCGERLPDRGRPLLTEGTASRSCVGRLAAICSAMAERAASIPGGRGTLIEAAKLARAGAIACCTDRAIDSLSDRSASWVAGPMIESVKSA